MKVDNLMQDPNFDTAQAKKETKILEETALRWHLYRLML
jgi:hypothetical protein